MTFLTKAKAPHGFTLVELAISLMIIGLLIGGVLKGIELVNNAKSLTIARQISSYQTASLMFLSTYKALPGDIRDPSDRLPNCGSGTLCDDIDGNGNGQIRKDGGNQGDYGYILDWEHVNESEPRGFFLHLAVAGMIAGIDTTDTTPAAAEFGRVLPAIEDGNNNGVTIAYYPYSDRGGSWTPLPSGNYFQVANSDNNTTALKPATAAYIDAKLDDGLGATGNVRAAGHANNEAVGVHCLDSGTMLYDETSTERLCGLIIKLDAAS